LIENNGHFRIFIVGIKTDRKTDRLIDGKIRVGRWERQADTGKEVV